MFGGKRREAVADVGCLVDPDRPFAQHPHRKRPLSGLHERRRAWQHDDFSIRFAPAAIIEDHRDKTGLGELLSIGDQMALQATPAMAEQDGWTSRGRPPGLRRDNLDGKPSSLAIEGERPSRRILHGLSGSPSSLSGRYFCAADLSSIRNSSKSLRQWESWQK